MPEISIIVPVYKVEKYVSRCIESILAQTFTDFELILVDDGSPDKSGEICDEYAKKDNRIRVIHKENGGQSSARNCGLDAAVGNYIGFIDSDDFITPDMYEALYNLVKKENADIAECYSVPVHDSLIPDNLIRKEAYYVHSGIELLPAIYQPTPYGNIAVPMKLFSAELFKNVRFEEGRIFEDTLMMPFVYFKANKVVSTENQYYCYFQGGVSTTRSEFSLKKLDMLYVCHKLRNFYYERNLLEAGLWLDTTYAFVLIGHIKKLKLNSHLDPNKIIRKKIAAEFRRLLPAFLKNPHFLWKQKILLIGYSITL